MHLEQLPKAEPAVQEEKCSTPSSLEIPRRKNSDGNAPKGSAPRGSAPATALLIQEVRWDWNRAAAGHIEERRE